MENTPSDLDLHLTNHDLQALSSADAVAAFFSKLGYNTNARTPQAPSNLGITSESAARPIKKIELIADQDSQFQIYLIEVKRVTISHARELTRSFKNRAGNFLFLLTSDYERIDFVLLEKLIPSASKSKTIKQPQVGIRNRTLTIDRKKGSPENIRIWLRVLRRFTFTEEDPYSQYDKIKNAYTIADWSEEYFNNRALFSDYFLMERLRDYPEWKEDPKPVFKELNNLVLGHLKKIRGQKEEVLRKNLLEPVFKILQFDWKVGKKAGSDATEADYLLFSPENKTNPTAFCLAYPWARHLDGKDPKDPESPEEDPSRVVVSLLEDDKAPWAIVTNGKVWRLYSKKAHSKASNYYEIDLEEVLVHSGQTDAYADFFKYFWLFFRREAFEPLTIQADGESRETTFLDRLLTESEHYAKELGDRLKEQVFEQIFPHLSEGFIAYIREKEGAKAELGQERLDLVFQGTLTFLYRLLFLLYAEARDLLPVKETRGFYEISLTRMKQEIAEKAGKLTDEAVPNLKKTFKKSETKLYDRLTVLFGVIDQGDSATNVPVYNGGLFLNKVPKDDQSAEAQNTRFLNSFKVPDSFLALALNRLTRDEDPKRQDLVMIDFKSLGVRQLGSIYEGLLEFKLRIAPEKMAVVKGKKTEQVLTYKQAKKDDKKILTKGRGRNAPERVFPKGAVYLENDKHERKATGSYYTPDHIVKYIVQNAVGPVLEEKFEKEMRPKLRDAQKAYRDARKRKEAFEKENLKGDDPEKVAYTYRQVVDELFRVRVLDPAMGSGHFLVEAVDFITDKTIHFLNKFPWNPVTSHLEETRQTILREMDEQKVSIDPARLTDINLLKRHVLKRCIYGVDLNPMAVELAKVSLWLNCFTLGAPLSFLDHHMKCGNSLIGSKVEEVKEAMDSGQISLFSGNQFAGLMLATDLMRHIGELSDVTSAQVKESRQEYNKARDELKPYKSILNIYTSQWFSNPRKKVKVKTKIRGEKKTKEISDAVNFLKSEHCTAWLENKFSTKGLDGEEKNTIEKALADAEEKRFFHWELEFPEVFYGPREGTTQVIERLGDSGFDAVVGNPPYVNAIELKRILSEKEKPYWKQVFETAKGAFDLYILFLEMGLKLINKKGYAGLITPNKFLSAPYAESLRSFLIRYSAISRIFDVSNQKTFDDPSVYPIVFIYKRLGAYLPETFLVERITDNSLRRFPHEYKYLNILPDYIWGFLLSEGFSVLKKVLKGTEQFIKLCDINASTTASEADMYSVCLEEKVGIPKKGWKVVNSGIIEKYKFKWGTKYMVNKRLKYKTPWLKDDKRIISERRRRHYNSEKIIFSKMALCIKASYDSKGEFASLNTNFAFVKGDAGFYYLGLLNSSLLTWLYEQYFGALKMSGGYLQFQAPQIRVLPLHKYDPKNEINCMIVKKVKTFSRIDQIDSSIQADIDRLVFTLYGLTQKDIEVIQGNA